MEELTIGMWSDTGSVILARESFCSKWAKQDFRVNPYMRNAVDLQHSDLKG